MFLFTFCSFSFFNSNFFFFIVGLSISWGVQVIFIYICTNVCLGVGDLAKNVNLNFFFLRTFDQFSIFYDF